MRHEAEVRLEVARVRRRELVEARPRRGDPEPRTQLGEGPCVVHVAEEGRLEVQHHEADLVHLAAEELVDGYAGGLAGKIP